MALKPVVFQMNILNNIECVFYFQLSDFYAGRPIYSKLYTVFVLFFFKQQNVRLVNEVIKKICHMDL